MDNGHIAPSVPKEYVASNKGATNWHGFVKLNIRISTPPGLFWWKEQERELNIEGRRRRLKER
jgi:hypothetical protein